VRLAPANEARVSDTWPERLMGVAGESVDECRYRRMRFIRRFEQTLLTLFWEGVLNGTLRGCIGQEANAVAVAEHLTVGDHVFSNHRCRRHYFVRTGDALGLLAGIMGQDAGVCGGRQHISAPGSSPMACWAVLFQRRPVSPSPPSFNATVGSGANFILGSGLASPSWRGTASWARLTSLDHIGHSRCTHATRTPRWEAPTSRPV
jgi:Dehydrogenase E1 component